MKQIFCLIMITALTIGFMFPNMTYVVAAENKNEILIHEIITDGLDDIGYKSIEIIRYNREISQYALQSENQISMTMEIVAENGDVYYSEKKGLETEVYLNDNYLATIKYSNPNARLIIPQFTNGDRYLSFAGDTDFSNFALASYSTWVIEQIQSFALDQISALIINGIVGALPYYVQGAHEAYSIYSKWVSRAVLAGDLISIGQGDGTLSGDYYAATVVYGSYHRDCNILAWYGTKNYTMEDPILGTIDRSGTSDFMWNTSHTWNGHPQDYTQPYGCRLLENYQKD